MARAAEPVTRLQLSFQVNDLKKLDIGSKSDPMIVAYRRLCAAGPPRNRALRTSIRSAWWHASPTLHPPARRCL
jgi:hypothetical protein